MSLSEQRYFHLKSNNSKPTIEGSFFCYSTFVNERKHGAVTRRITCRRLIGRGTICWDSVLVDRCGSLMSRKRKCPLLARKSILIEICQNSRWALLFIALKFLEIIYDKCSTCGVPLVVGWNNDIDAYPDTVVDRRIGQQNRWSTYQFTSTGRQNRCHWSGHTGSYSIHWISNPAEGVGTSGVTKWQQFSEGKPIYLTYIFYLF